MAAGAGSRSVVGGDFGNLERLRSTWQDRKATTSGPQTGAQARVGPVDPSGERPAPIMIRNTSSTWGGLARCLHWILGARDHRHDRLWLVDEPLPGTPGSLFLSLDPCRYRLSRAAADGVATDLARPQSDPGLARGHAALATDSGERQPLVALCRDDPGGAAWLGAFRRPHAELFEIGSGCFTFRRLPRPTGKRPAAWEDRHILFAYVLLALIAHPSRGGAVASLCPA